MAPKPKSRTNSKWTAGEDAKLLALVKRHGTKNWTLISKSLSNRKGKQCRERYRNHLDPHISHEPFTDAEDQDILRHVVEIGTRWARIAELMPGRTENAIKNRYYSNLVKRPDAPKPKPNPDADHAALPSKSKSKSKSKPAKPSSSRAARPSRKSRPSRFVPDDDYEEEDDDMEDEVFEESESESEPELPSDGDEQEEEEQEDDDAGEGSFVRPRRPRRSACKRAREDAHDNDDVLAGPCGDSDGDGDGDHFLNHDNVPRSPEHAPQRSASGGEADLLAERPLKKLRTSPACSSAERIFADREGSLKDTRKAWRKAWREAIKKHKDFADFEEVLGLLNAPKHKDIPCTLEMEAIDTLQSLMCSAVVKTVPSCAAQPGGAVPLPGAEQWNLFVNDQHVD